jgi:hypothetical protein
MLTLYEGGRLQPPEPISDGAESVLAPNHETESLISSVKLNPVIFGTMFVMRHHGALKLQRYAAAVIEG